MNSFNQELVPFDSLASPETVEVFVSGNLLSAILNDVVVAAAAATEVVPFGVGVVAQTGVVQFLWVDVVDFGPNVWGVVTDFSPNTWAAI